MDTLDSPSAHPSAPPADNSTLNATSRTEDGADHRLPAGHSRARNTRETSAVERRRELKALSTILSIPVRWEMLYIFAREDLVSVTGLAGKVRMSRPATSMHLRVLKDAGMIESTIGRLYRLAPALRPAPGVEYLDLGLCRLQLPPPA